MKDIHLLNPTHLLYHAVGKPRVKGIKKLGSNKRCSLCGLPTTDAVGWEVGKKFSNLDLFAEKENIDFLCPACHYALSHIKELHKAYILRYTEGLKILQFDDQPSKKIGIGQKRIVSRYYLRDFLSNPPVDDPWIMMLQTKMNPQHSIMKAKVNFGYADTLWVCNGGINYAIPKKGLVELFNALEKVKKSDSLYPYLFNDKRPWKEHKEIKLWEEVEPIIVKHRCKHYLSFIYDRIIPPKNYMLKDTDN
ncbi:hypothetical protein [Oceanobacillus bengalensis]|uniref:Uncharacterized protein n=1 Tax=Oceanobacillus bengalensis TaxID=1435466 RepID=A0A494Z8E8_9BACI|nr:hypothetical protein [Oceanobacillus bengalensis]RKQ18297.1 hypothetical protein D8M05_02540 [Oceanobacillus bengalensis]